MRRDSINYLTVGTFVLGMFAVFLVILYQITGRSGAADEYYVNYQSVEGIKYGTPVLYEGYQVGQVEDVEPERAGGGINFKITLAVTEGWSIPEDSIAAVVKSGLLSAVAIDIQEGESSRSLAPESYITGLEATDIFSAVNDVAAEIKLVSRENVRPLLENLNVQISSLSAELRELLDESVRPVLDGHVRDMFTKLDTSLDGLNQVLGAENRNHLSHILGNLDTASADAGDLLVGLAQTRQRLDDILVKVDSVVDQNDEDINESVQDLQKSLNVISEHIEAIAYYMEGSSRNMHEFTREIRENPSALLRGSPKIEETGGAE